MGILVNLALVSLGYGLLLFYGEVVSGTPLLHRFGIETALCTPLERTDDYAIALGIKESQGKALFPTDALEGIEAYQSHPLYTALEFPLHLFRGLSQLIGFGGCETHLRNVHGKELSQVFFLTAGQQCPITPPQKAYLPVQ